MAASCGGRCPAAVLFVLQLGLLQLALHVTPVASQTLVSYNGVTYEIYLSASDTATNLMPVLKTQPWWGSSTVAETFTRSVGSQLGLPNGAFGPWFVFAETGTGGFPQAFTWLSGAPQVASISPGNNRIFALAKVSANGGGGGGGGGDDNQTWRVFDPVTSSILWAPQAGLDCRATCANMYMLAVSASKPTDALPNPPLLCANIGTLLKDPTLTIPGSLADDAYRFFLSEGYTQPIAGNTATGLPAQSDSRGCTSYLEGTTPDAQNYLCGCVPPRKSANGAPQKPWRWVPASTDSCTSDSFKGYVVPFACRVRATGLIGHLNTQNCGFPSAEDIKDCEFGQETTQPASKFPAGLTMPPAKPDFPDCVYATRVGVAGSTQEVASWNSVDRLCITSSFRYFVYRWAKKGVDQL